MIPRNVDYFRSVAGHSQDQADDFIMIGIPIPGSSKAPAVNDVANQVEFFALDVPQKIHKGVTAAAPQAEMNIRNEDGSEGLWRRNEGHWLRS
jgi:hypothetical protein